MSQQAFDQAQEQLTMAQAILNERKAQLNNTKQTLTAQINQEKEIEKASTIKNLSKN